MQEAWATVKRECHCFRMVIEKSDERFFFLLFSLFVTSKLMYMIGWISPFLQTIWLVHQVLFTVVMWGSAIYLFTIIVEWRNAWTRTGELIAIGCLLFALTGIISRVVTTDSYAFIMGSFFCVMACGKNYKKTLNCFLTLLSSSLAVGLLGLKTGITFDAAKPNREFGGHSLGILYPNNWGFIVFAILVIIWYLFLQRKKLINLILFWAAAIFMFKYITCYTIAAMAFAFPLFAIGAEWIQKKESGGERSKNRIIRGIIIALPFFFLFGMLFLCWQMDWVYNTFYKFYDTSLRSFAMRFVEGGYALKLNGVSLFGHPFRPFDSSVVGYSKEIEMIVDSAFICYLIIRGIIAMGMTLGWLCLAHRRCLKEKDYRLLAISVFMLLLSTMERPGLDAWYNFVFLYPLASLSSKEHSRMIAEEAAQ